MDNWLAKPPQTGPQILAWAEEFPRHVRLREQPTFGGHVAYAVTVTDADAPGEKRRLLVAQPHAHEPAATAGMMSFLGRLLTGTGPDGRGAGLDRQRVGREAELTFIPDGNPDGRSRAPADWWDGRSYTNDEFLNIAFGTSPGGERFERQGRWSLDDQRPATLGIVYEQINEKEFVEPNRDLASSYCRLIFGILADAGADRLLSLHQTEFENSQHNAMMIVPFLQDELPPAIRRCNDAWARAVIRAWRDAGANPMPEPRTLGYGEDQLRYFRKCWSDVYASIPAVTVEVQNNNTRTDPEAQRQLQEAAIRASIEHLLAS